jgi:hypothetical protein
MFVSLLRYRGILICDNKIILWCNYFSVTNFLLNPLLLKITNGLHRTEISVVENVYHCFLTEINMKNGVIVLQTHLLAIQEYSEAFSFNSFPVYNNWRRTSSCSLSIRLLSSRLDGCHSHATTDVRWTRGCGLELVHQIDKRSYLHLRTQELKFTQRFHKLLISIIFI